MANALEFVLWLVLRLSFSAWYWCSN